MPGVEPAKPRHRQWTTIDGMILVAATGIGLVCVRQIDREEAWRWSFPRRMTHVEFCAMLAQIPMLASAAALLVIGRNHRGEPIWRLLRRPGLSACAFGLVGVAFSLLMAWIHDLIRLPQGITPARFRGIVHEVSRSYAPSGYFILIAWMTQLATGVWRPSPGWDDRLGRFLGIAWVVVTFAMGLGF